MVYLQNRRYLADNDELRNDRKSFPSKEELRQAPPMRKYEYLEEAHESYDVLKEK